MAKLSSRYFFWRGEVLYLGRGGSSALHRHHLIQLCLAPHGTLKVRASDQEAYIRHTGLLIDSDAPHQLVAAAREPILLLWLDQESRTGRRLRMHYGLDRTLVPIPEPERERIYAATRRLLHAETCSGALQVKKAVLDAIGMGPTAAPDLDERVQIEDREAIWSTYMPSARVLSASSTLSAAMSRAAFGAS